MKKSIILSLSILLTACALGGGPAQNRPQFVQGMKQYSIRNNDNFVFQTKVVNRDVHKIGQTLKSRIGCYNVHVDRKYEGKHMEMGRMVSYTHRQIIDYSGKVEKVGNGYELTLQRDDNSPSYVKNNPWPKGGIYILAINYKPAGNNKTRITIYQMPKTMGMDRWEVVTRPIINWSLGKRDNCPNLKTEKLI